MENLFLSKVRVSVSGDWEYYHKSTTTAKILFWPRLETKESKTLIFFSVKNTFPPFSTEVNKSLTRYIKQMSFIAHLEHESRN